MYVYVLSSTYHKIGEPITHLMDVNTVFKSKKKAIEAFWGEVEYCYDMQGNFFLDYDNIDQIDNEEFFFYAALEKRRTEYVYVILQRFEVK